MYNLRYHLITVVSIFFSLAIGLLLGAAIGGSEAFRQTSSSLVENLREDYNKVSTERDKLRAELEKDDRLSHDFVKHWTLGRLENKTLLLLVDSHSTAVQEHIDDMVKLAGGHLVKLIINYDSLQALSDAEKAELTQLLKDVMVNDKKTASAKLEELLALCIAKECKSGALMQVKAEKTASGEHEKHGDEKQKTTDQVPEVLAAEELPESQQDTQAKIAVKIIPYLLDKKLLTIVDGPEKAYTLDAVIDSALSKDASSHELGLLLTSAFAQLKIPGVLTQFNGRDKQLLIDAQTRGFSGVASCDSMIGSYSLIALLTGAEPGVYGIEGAKPYPVIPQDKKASKSQKDRDSHEEGEALKEEEK